MFSRFGYFKRFDWILTLATLPIIGAGLLTMRSFTGDNQFFDKQLAWISIALIAFVICSFIDWRFLKRTDVIVWLFLLAAVFLLALLGFGRVVRGAQTRFNVGFASFQPADFVKLVLIIILAKYFSRRHIEIAHIRHILVSGFYAFTFFVLIFLQPDFGSAVAIFSIWLGMVLVSGISKKHLALVFLVGILSFASLWVYVFKDYQKQRVINFVNPLADIHGSGYNAYQSTIAIGSGQVFGKGVGYGTQSRLKFLPEYETDFIFAAFAEEWGFIGAVVLFTFYALVFWRILVNAMSGATNFETLFCLGVAIFLLSHVIINIGMNIGLLPVTGITLPFMSYGGTHLLVEFACLGILTGMRHYRREIHKTAAENEILGLE
jgi:rod shape determining protein RodA